MKPKLVLLHGWGMHGGIWGEFAERLAQARFGEIPGIGVDGAIAAHVLLSPNQPPEGTPVKVIGIPWAESLLIFSRPSSTPNQ